jgi:hypothetical protein
VLDNLAEFGSGRALDPLADFITSDVSAELKAQACSTVAAVLRRVEGRPAEDLIEALAQALAEGEQNVQEAAAMALSVAGLEQERVVALATPRAGEVIPAKKPDISAIPAPSARTELLQYAPVNTAAIVHIDVKKLMKTAGEEGLPVTGLPAAFEGAAEVMVFVQEPAGHLAFDTDTAAIVVVPGSTRQKLAEALAGPGVEKVNIGDLEMFKTTAGTESYAVVANDTTFVIGSDEGMAQMVHHNVTTKSGATLPRPLTIAFGDHRRSPVNLAAYFSEDYLERVGDELPAAVDGIRTASMGLDIEDGVKAHVQAQYRTERAAILARGNVQGQIEYAQTRVQRLAEQAEEGMKAALQQGAKVLDKVEVGGIGRGLTVSTTITPEDVQMLMGMLMASVTADVDATVE